MLKYFIHPETKEKLPVKDCLEKGLLSEYYPLPYLRMCAEERKWNGQPSTTQLIGGLREAFLKIFCDYATDPDSHAFKIIGTKGHGKLEDSADDELSEISIKDSKVSMIADLLEPKEDGTFRLVDYKTSGSYKVMLSAGLIEKKRPAFDENGNPILYQKSGKWGKAGEQKLEKYFEVDESRKDIYDYQLQLNHYRMVLEEKKGIKISEMVIFFVVRDGGLLVAKNRGIEFNTKMINVPFMSNDEVKEFFHKRAFYLKEAIETCNKRLQTLLTDREQKIQIQTLCPSKCDDRECWNGRKCKGHCDVLEFCKAIEENKLW